MWRGGLGWAAEPRMKLKSRVGVCPRVRERESKEEPPRCIAALRRQSALAPGMGARAQAARERGARLLDGGGWKPGSGGKSPHEQVMRCEGRQT